MGILLITGIEGARNCADMVAKHVGMPVHVADGRKAALALLAKERYAAAVVDETVVGCDPSAAEAIWKRAGLAIPLQFNFALAGAARLIREIRAALARREREQMIAHRAAAESFESKVNNTVAGLLLHSQLALSSSDAGSPATEKLRVVASLADELRSRLAERSARSSTAENQGEAGARTMP